MKLRRDLWFIILTLIILIIWINGVGVLFGSHNKRESFYRIDSVRLLSRAYSVTPAKSSAISGYEFQDETYHHFRLEEPYFCGIIPNSRLYDTLQYSDLVLTVLTDKEGLDIFNSKRNSKIYIRGLEIGGRSYIDQALVEVKRKKAARDRIIYFTLVYFIGLSIYLYNRRRL